MTRKASGIKRTPKKPVQRRIGANPKASKKKKQTRKELWGQYGLEVPKYIRYSGLQGVLWWVLSRYVRQEEFIKYGGKCVDGCGKPIEAWEDADCGHFRSAKSLATRFLRENVAIQRKNCNSPRGGNGRQYDFGLEVDRRWGKGTADRLTELAGTTSNPFKAEWYDNEIRKYLKLLGTGDSAKYPPDVPDT